MKLNETPNSNTTNKHIFAGNDYTENFRVAPNERYQHYKGDQYIVVALATDATILETIVIYRKIDSKRLWTRFQTDFLAFVDNRTNRFERMCDTCNKTRCTEHPQITTTLPLPAQGD